MQKNHIFLIILFFSCITIFCPYKTYSQIATPEVVAQQSATTISSTLQPNEASNSDLLSVEDTQPIDQNEPTDPLSAFDESKPLPKETDTIALPLDEPAPSMGYQPTTETLSPEQVVPPQSITTAQHTTVLQYKPKKEKESHKERREKRKQKKQERKQQQEAAQKIALIPDNSLNFDVENKTGKTVYTTSFTYIKKRPFTRWRWHKSNVYKIEDNKKATIDIHHIEDEQDRLNTFGYLTVFDTQKEADEAIFELTPDRNKLELDLLVHLKGKTVVLEIEKYGKSYEFWDYDFVPKKQKGAVDVPEVDFVVENRTGKTILVTCFTFQKKAKGTWLAQKTKADWTSVDETRDDMSVWRFDKAPIITLKPGESGIIDVDTIIEPRDRSEVQGYLAIFDEDEREKAVKAVYELLPPENKIQLGKLVKLNGKKVILEIEKYGILGDLINFTVKPVNRIDFSRLDRSKVTKRSQKR